MMIVNIDYLNNLFTIYYSSSSFNQFKYSCYLLVTLYLCDRKDLMFLYIHSKSLKDKNSKNSNRKNKLSTK